MIGWFEEFSNFDQKRTLSLGCDKVLFYYNK